MTLALSITASILREIAPQIPPSALAAFLADGGENNTAIEDILLRCDITSREAIAMFLAIAAYDSEGFTKYRAAGNVILTGAEWLYARAKRWCDAKPNVGGLPMSLNQVAALNTQGAFEIACHTVSYGTAHLGVRRQYWRRACGALGVKIEKTPIDSIGEDERWSPAYRGPMGTDADDEC